MCMDRELIRLIVLGALSFACAMAWNPLLIALLKRYKCGKQIRASASAPVMSALHAKKSGTPTMGGVLIWGTVLLLAALLLFVERFFPHSWLGSLSFLTRPQTLLPLGALVASALLGLVDDWMNIRQIGPHGGGMSMSYRLALYTGIAVVGAWWFFVKLGWDVLHVPFFGDFIVGWWYIPIFFVVIVATAFSVNETDGLDGLAGGTVLAAFGAYATIAFAQGRFDLAAFCVAIVGALLAFLWSNVYPARVFMGDTGSMGLGVSLGIVAMLTNMAAFLPLIGLVLVCESLSVIVQRLSKRFLKRKLFRSTPVHHHFEAIGWEEPTIVMRAWVIACMSAALGVALALLDIH